MPSFETVQNPRAYLSLPRILEGDISTRSLKQILCMSPPNTTSTPSFPSPHKYSIEWLSRAFSFRWPSPSPKASLQGLGWLLGGKLPETKKRELLMI